MINWIKDFSDTYRGITRYLIIYTARSWWKMCTGDSTAIKNTSLTSWTSSPGPILGVWPFLAFWKYDNRKKWGGDSELFNGSFDQLKTLAKGS